MNKSVDIFDSLPNKSHSPDFKDTEEQQDPLECGSTKQHAQEKCIHKLFEEQVGQNPEAVAIGFEGTQISYEEFNARSNRIAHTLINLDLKVNQPVAILLENGPQQFTDLRSFVEERLPAFMVPSIFVVLDALPVNQNG